MDPRPIVVPSGHGARVGNVEFLARTADTPRFTFGIIEIAPGRELDAHVHADEDDAFYIVDGELTLRLRRRARWPAPAPARSSSSPPGVEHGFRNRRRRRPCGCSTSMRRPGFDRRIGLTD